MPTTDHIPAAEAAALKLEEWGEYEGVSEHVAAIRAVCKELKQARDDRMEYWTEFAGESRTVAMALKGGGDGEA